MSSATNFSQMGQDEQKRLLDKLAKLKALSECPTGNVNETATAAATMMRLMLEYQIESADLEGAASGEPEELFDGPVFEEDSMNGYPLWKQHLLSTLAKVNHCMSYSASRVEHSWFTQRTRSQLCIIGAQKDVENTKRLFFFCVDEIERLCKVWGRGQPVKRKNDFRKGAGRGVGDKVKEEHDRVLREEQERAAALQQSSSALELFGRKLQAVRQRAAEIGIHTTTTRSRGVQHDAYASGYTAGSNLDLGGGRRAALPPGRG